MNARETEDPRPRLLKDLDELTKDSTMTEEQAIEIGRAWRRDIHKRVSGQ